MEISVVIPLYNEEKYIQEVKQRRRVKNLHGGISLKTIMWKKEFQLIQQHAEMEL